MMTLTLTSLLVYVGIAAVILSLATHYIFKKVVSWPMTYIQHFCGALFIFSGWVKAVDPLGTAYKMEQYFDQFSVIFDGTWFAFLGPLFPLLNNYVVIFSLFMIIFEIVLGLMLILGHKPKFTAWAFFLLVAFFTVLTGFTYLTGYVPNDVNFFNFSGWGEYVKTNMKVTDCGCFGDFLVLEPKVSFMKDIFLLIPAVYFLFKSSVMHTILNKTTRNISLSIITVGLIFYCLSNYYWDIPSNDFRPFRKGRNIAEQKHLEEESAANTKILFYDVTNKTSGEKKRLAYADYLKTFKDYPSEEWNLDQIYSEPEVKETKISHFHIDDLEGNDITEDILASEKPVVVIVAHKMHADGVMENVVVKDTIYRVDTVLRDDKSYDIVRNIASVNERTEQRVNYLWKGFYEDIYKETIKPFTDQALAEGLEVVMIIGGAGNDQIIDFERDMNLGIRYATADDILLKTIVRSNPGIVLFKNGVLLNKWHHKKLPTYEQVKNDYLN